jgi:hypothetical protein
MPQTHSPEVYYSPLIIVLMRKIFENWRSLHVLAALVEFHPPIFVDAASVFMFICFYGAPYRGTLEGSYL